MKRFTVWFTLVGVGLCLLHFIGFDYKNMLLVGLSIPLWILAIFTDLRSINILLVYFLTIVSWTALGYLLDYLIQRDRVHKL